MVTMVEVTVVGVVTGWLLDGQGMVTEWLREDYGVVTGWLWGGHGVVSITWSIGPKNWPEGPSTRNLPGGA